MNFNNKNSDNINFDDLNIKTHLNNSLDLNGICVSEELIQKTLQAIKEQSSTNIDLEENHKKRKEISIPWNIYIRSLTGVAAAALLLFVGYQVANSTLFNATKGNMENRTADMAKEESVQQDIFVTMENAVDDAANGIDGTDTSYGATEYKMDATGKAEIEMSATPADKETNTELNIDLAEKDSDQGLMREDVTIKSSLSGVIEEENYSITGEHDLSNLFGFQEILPLTVEQITKITITDEVNQKSLTLLEQKDISELYSLMKRYQYSGSAGIHDNNMYYTIAMETTDDIHAIVRLGAVLTIESSDGEVSSMSGYNVVNHEELLRELNVFISKY